MRRKSPRTYQESYYSSPRSAKQISESFSIYKRTLQRHLGANKRNSVHYVNVKQAKEKLETELLVLKEVNSRDSNVLLV